MRNTAGFICALLPAVLSTCAAAEVTYRDDVAPILQRHCTGCHQPGEIGPMALTSYREVRPWARAIREQVKGRAMPPWDAAPSMKHRFRNDRALSEADIGLIVKWVDAGAKEGGASEAFVAAQRGSEWKLGKPDLIVRVPGFPVPDNGVLPYTFLIFSGLFPKDTWVRAAEWRIEQRQAIHHINAFTRTPGSSFLAGFPTGKVFVPTVQERGKRRQGERLFDRRQLLLGYEPGYVPMPWLDDGAKFIAAGSDVVFEMHYTPNGKAVTDHSELALYFAPQEPKYRVLAIDTLRDLDLEIAPGDRNSVSKAAMTLGQNARLLSIQPHMHLRGKSMCVTAVDSGGQKDVLLDVPKYDFRWQTTYVLEDPVELTAGTRLESVAAFDNSPDNRLNPDPAATVHWGDQTSDEMHIAFLELAIPAKDDPESLLRSAPKMLGERKLSSQRFH